MFRYKTHILFLVVINTNVRAELKDSPLRTTEAHNFILIVNKTRVNAKQMKAERNFVYAGRDLDINKYVAMYIHRDRES